jgi:hypothetical protein
MKLKVVVVDLELPPRVKRWGIRLGIPIFMLSVAALAYAAPTWKVWNTGDTLQAADLNGNFSILQGQVHVPSGFRAELTTTATVPNAARTTVKFDHVLYDEESEFTAATGTFSPKQAGTYLVQCSLCFNATASAVYGTQVQNNGMEISGFNAEASVAGEASSSATSGVFALEAGDSLICDADQLSGATQSIANIPDRNFFSAVRLY